MHHPLRSAGERVGQFRFHDRRARLVEGAARLCFDSGGDRGDHAGREDTSLYDRATGRGVWTGAYEALESALNDSATGVSMLAADGEVLNDPLTAARNKAREGMSLPTMSNETDANLIATLAADDVDSEPSSGIDISVTKDIEGLDAFLSDESSQTALDECEERFYESLMPRPQNNQQ